jgi:hypothetical protein
MGDVIDFPNKGLNDSELDRLCNDLETASFELFRTGVTAFIRFLLNGLRHMDAQLAVANENFNAMDGKIEKVARFAFVHAVDSLEKERGRPLPEEERQRLASLVDLELVN